MHGPINVKSPNNTSKWRMGFNSAFKGLSEMCSQGVVSSKEASDNSGLCPVQGQKSGLGSRTGARYQFWSLCLDTEQT
jgi:hypothetical protein